MPAEAQNTALLVGDWRLFCALEAHLRDGVLDDYLRKHCTGCRWICLIFASRYPYLAEIGIRVILLPGGRPPPRPPSASAEDASRVGAISRSRPQAQTDWASLHAVARLDRIGTEGLRRYLLVPKPSEAPRSKPVGPLSAQELRACEVALSIEDTFAKYPTIKIDAVVASYLAWHIGTQQDVDMEDASSVCGGTGTRNSPRAAEEESTASRELHPGPNMDGDSPEVQGDDGPRQEERLEPLQERAWQTRAEEHASDANDQAAAPSHWHSAPPSPIQTPLPRPREAPRAKTTGKRHRICKLPLSPRVAVKLHG